MMDTNYYLHAKAPCECCGRPYEPLHIGKSVVGWCFALHVIPKLGLDSLKAWMRAFDVQGTVIYNEYDEKVGVEEMLRIITKRGREPEWEANWYRGYPSEQDFHRCNYSERGPSGLLRVRIGLGHCVGHGEGTWDYIEGEFS